MIELYYNIVTFGGYNRMESNYLKLIDHIAGNYKTLEKQIPKYDNYLIKSYKDLDIYQQHIAIKLGYTEGTIFTYLIDISSFEQYKDYLQNGFIWLEEEYIENRTIL